MISSGGIARYTAEEIRALSLKAAVIEDKIVQYEELDANEDHRMSNKIAWKTGGDEHTIPEVAVVTFHGNDGRNVVEVSHYGSRVRAVQCCDGDQDGEEILFVIGKPLSPSRGR